MKISIIIPCYNHGLYIQDALDSILECKAVESEVIIIDDGSNDSLTKIKLDSLEAEGYNVIRQKNQGLAYSRNLGIQRSRGEYILTLDSDNKIKPEYIVKALRYLDCRECDIVYGKPIFFGDSLKSREFEVKPFDGPELFINNYIDACAIFRREVWVDLGGYDLNFPYSGNEDWEFWLHAYIKGFKFIFIEEPLYYYRILETSMMGSAAADTHEKNREYILLKHFSAYKNAMTSCYAKSKMYQNDIENPLRASIKYFSRFLGIKEVI